MKRKYEKKIFKIRVFNEDKFHSLRNPREIDLKINLVRAKYLYKRASIELWKEICEARKWLLGGLFLLDNEFEVPDENVVLQIVANMSVDTRELPVPERPGDTCSLWYQITYRLCFCLRHVREIIEKEMKEKECKIYEFMPLKKPEFDAARSVTRRVAAGR